MRCKIVRFQKLIWRNMMRSTKSQKALILYYSIDRWGNSCIYSWQFQTWIIAPRNGSQH